MNYQDEKTLSRPLTKGVSRRIAIIIVILLFSIWTTLQLHVEWLWFSQFNLVTVLIKQWGWQVSSFIISLIIVSASSVWIRRWLLISNSDQKIRYKKYLHGWRYFLYLIFSVNLILVSFIWLSYFSLKLGNEPFDNITHLLDYAKNIPILTIAVYFISITLLISKTGQKLIYLATCGLFSYCIVKSWGTWALALAIPDAGINDKLLGADISFALGKYPALLLGSILLLNLQFILLGLAIWIKLVMNSNIGHWRSNSFSDKQKRHLRPFVISILLNLSVIVWLSRHHFLWNDGNFFPGADWLDVHLNIPLRTCTSILLLISVCSFIPGFRASIRKSVRYISFLAIICGVIIELLVGPLIQWFIVKPRELSLESPYISRAIVSTRRAFQLDSIKTRLFNPASKLRRKDLELGKSTLRNIRLWDSQPLLATNRQLQQLRVYYRFSNASVDRYKLNPDSTERQQIMITARELEQEALPENSRSWLNRHFVFTHGYGFTVSPVNTKAEDGLPEYFIRDLGNSTRVEGSKMLNISKQDVETSVPIGRAAIYYGIYPSPYAIAPTRIEELDYPEGDQNIFNHYDGNGGIPLSNYLERISAAVYLSEPRLIITGLLTNKSRLLIRRDVRERVKVVAPFIQIKGDPYLVSVAINENTPDYKSNQHQYWIIEGYTTSDTYPYAAKISNKNKTRYIRNSVKAVVDAYSGKVNLYISESNDPIILAWKKLFPELIKPLDEMPVIIQEHLKVPTELFEVQVEQLLRYHVTDPRTFYSGDDIWQVPVELYGDKQIPVEPYHVTAQLRPNDESEFLLLQPLTPLARPNLSAWLAARSDAPNYGQLVLIRFPSETTIYGPEQIQALINQDPIISQQFSLWDRAGSEVIQGNLLVLPLGQSLLYVEPVYLKASQGGLPTLTRVVVSDGRRIAMEKDLMTGLNSLLRNE